MLTNLNSTDYKYSKTCLKWPLSKRPKIGFQDQLLLNAGQKYCRMEHSAILSTSIKLPGRVAQSVMCLAIAASLTADPGVASLILAHTFVEIDHEIISTVIHLPSTEACKKGCCQLQAKVCAQSTG